MRPLREPGASGQVPVQAPDDDLLLQGLLHSRVHLRNPGGNEVPERRLSVK